MLKLLSRRALPALAVGLSLLGSVAFAQSTVTTQFGDVTVPANPQRVIVLSEDALDAALALGIKPVASTARRGGTTDLPNYLADKSEGIEVVGLVREINMEAVITAAPDVILAAAGLPEDQYATFSQIAPTIVPPTGGTRGWRENFQLRAEALGKVSEGEAILAQVEARSAEVKALVGDHSGETAAIIRWQEAGPVVYTWKSLSGETLASVGFSSVPMATELTGPHTDPLSLENLSEVDADWLVIAAFGDSGKAAYESITTDPIYQSLKAVKSGQVIVSDGNLWSSTNGPLAALAQLDVVAEGLAQN